MSFYFRRGEIKIKVASGTNHPVVSGMHLWLGFPRAANSSGRSPDCTQGPRQEPLVAEYICRAMEHSSPYSVRGGIPLRILSADGAQNVEVDNVLSPLYYV